MFEGDSGREARGAAIWFCVGSSRAGLVWIWVGGGGMLFNSTLGASGDFGAAAASAGFSAEGGPSFGRSTRGSRRTPRMNSPPSLRQFRATAANCSRCHFTVSLDPTVMGFLSRIHAPDGDVSSSVAGVRHPLPAGSTHETSATAHRIVLGSMSRPSMPFVSAWQQESLVTRGSTDTRVPSFHVAPPSRQLKAR